ncbi:hotdog domain-containing protein (plasmid) [Salipiger sp. H15]|uniref:Hotdog domain-containing protein n=1 Tax=Alloyangia sp. H15 TaxID=3029062 RepID=A0AAU8ASN3_9RHOB
MTEAVTRPGTPPCIVTVAPHAEVTPRGAVFGGWILSQLDHAAGLAGRKIAGGDVVIASLKDVQFHAPLHGGEEFTIHAELSRRGTSSFNLAVSAWAEPDGAGRRILSADVLLVAVDGAGRPRKLPA